MESLPVRECGLKLPFIYPLAKLYQVTPCAGVWIEIIGNRNNAVDEQVTPCAEVWIEIRSSENQRAA